LYATASTFKGVVEGGAKIYAKVQPRGLTFQPRLIYTGNGNGGGGGKCLNMKSHY